MEIKQADVADAAIIHHVMLEAFQVYKNETPPSSALEETLQSVSNALERGEKALIAMEENNPVGMVRFQLKNEELYFYRLSVIPEKQGRGIARKILKALEEYADKMNVTTVLCNVRAALPKNVQLYRSIGYEVYDEEILYRPNGITVKVVSMRKEL